MEFVISEDFCVGRCAYQNVGIEVHIHGLRGFPHHYLTFIHFDGNGSLALPQIIMDEFVVEVGGEQFLTLQVQIGFWKYDTLLEGVMNEPPILDVLGGDVVSKGVGVGDNVYPQTSIVLDVGFFHEFADTLNRRVELLIVGEKYKGQPVLIEQ